MKLLATVVSMLVLLTFAGTASAACPTPPTGPYDAGVSTWYNYTPDSNCWSSSPGDVSPTNLSCVGDPGFAYALGREKKISYTFTVGPSLATWSADAFIEFNDPHDDWFNQIEITALVNRNGTLYSYRLFRHNGTMGDLNGCQRLGGYFSASPGDTVTIEIKSWRWYSDTTIKSTGAFIFTSRP
jgi:hypothetical protein